MQQHCENVRAKSPCDLPVDVFEKHLVSALLWFASEGPGSRGKEIMTVRDLLILFANTALVCQQWYKSLERVTGLFDMKNCQGSGPHRDAFHSSLVRECHASTLWHMLNPGRAYRERAVLEMDCVPHHWLHADDTPRNSPEAWGIPWGSGSDYRCDGMCGAHMCLICCVLKEDGEHTCVNCEAVFCDRCANVHVEPILLYGTRRRIVCKDEAVCEMRQDECR